MNSRSAALRGRRTATSRLPPALKDRMERGSLKATEPGAVLTDSFARSGLPKYRNVAEQVKAALERGFWKPGDMLPTEAQLGEMFNCSAGTVKQAILGLARDGLLVRRAGKGTFVTRLDGSKSFARFFRFRESSSGDHLDPHIRVVTVKVLTKPPNKIRDALQIRGPDKVLFVRRILVQANTPICIYDSYLPYNLSKGLEREVLDHVRLYRALEEHLGIHVVSAEEDLRASVVVGKEAALLEVDTGAPVILIERRAFTHNNTIIEWRQTIGRSDKFVYKIKLP
jgi:GntR family transcriptional regulator